MIIDDFAAVPMGANLQAVPLPLLPPPRLHLHLLLPLPSGMLDKSRKLQT